MTAPEKGRSFNGWYATIEGDNLTVSVMVSAETPSDWNEQRAVIMAALAVKEAFAQRRAEESQDGRS